ncbi:hypothetical protein CAPTEDRAFT_116635 [Capitella teleta]|uniref:nucleoside-diphosphate kinase n=1 Tax=Capitella teleta TaxID=283909 RepID=R7TQX4_CAPTE|nr:hypothetical protein CAPTEDRAFT_116635 [Capitella teleta]|eukprot:ELT96064.1 hypothetical protein CAPTEDRAFT_116635 [Capitella teleta]
MAEERTFIMIKPDAVHRGLVADIIKRFEQKGFKLVAMKFMQASSVVKFDLFQFLLSDSVYSVLTGICGAEIRVLHST